MGTTAETIVVMLDFTDMCLLLIIAKSVPLNFYSRNSLDNNVIFFVTASVKVSFGVCLTIEVISKVVIPVQTGIQKFLQHFEKTGFPLSWE